MQVSGAWSWRQALSTGVPVAQTSTDLESASASHRGAAASLLDQSELDGGFRCKVKPFAAGVWCVVVAASTLHQSASGRDESTDLESASASHRGAAARLLDLSELHVYVTRCVLTFTVVSQARPHESVNTQLVPHGGRSSVNPDRIPPSSGSPPAPTPNVVCSAARQRPPPARQRPPPARQRPPPAQSPQRWW